MLSSRWKRILMWGLALLCAILMAVGLLFWWVILRPQGQLLSEMPETGSWERVAPDTLRFTGTIIAQDFEQEFDAVFDDQITTIYVHSGGGDVESALAVGEKIEGAGINLVVDTWCLSSCANYLFTAAAQKTINKGGIVGFHGNFNALLDQLSIEKILEDVDAEKRLSYREELETLRARETAFFQRLGISQELFDRTQRADKGVESNVDYAFLLPTIATMAKYGIHNISGVQSSKEIQRFADHNVDLLLE